MTPPSVEAPLGWRVHVLPANPRPADREFKPKPRVTTHATREEAEAEQQRQRAVFGDDAAICIEPLFSARAERKRALAATQDSLTAAGWPVQMRPPRPGMSSRRRRT